MTHLRLMLSPRLARIPFLFRGDSHVLCSAVGWKLKINRLLRSLIFRRFDRFLAVGEANTGYFRASGVADRKIRFVPHCVDNERFQKAAPIAEAEAIEWKHEIGIPEGATVVLFAGKFEEKKRPLDLLQAFLEFTAESVEHGAKADDAIAPSPVLLFVGSGELESKLREAAGRALNHTIFFAPFQNQTAMPKVYATGDLLVLPSFGRGETWGLAINEAMNLARPAIVSSHVGCGPDLVLQGETGWIFKAGDVDDLKKTLSTGLADPAHLKTMGLRARDHIANYSYDRATVALLKVIDETR
jgi:glycosyltransferase involved in cell wall biosynthesis